MFEVRASLLVINNGVAIASEQLSTFCNQEQKGFLHIFGFYLFLERSKVPRVPRPPDTRAQQKKDVSKTEKFSPP